MYALAALESFQDFLNQLDMKPRMHVMEITFFSLNNVTFRPTKIVNIADKNWAHILFRNGILLPKLF